MTEQETNLICALSEILTDDFEWENIVLCCFGGIELNFKETCIKLTLLSLNSSFLDEKRNLIKVGVQKDGIFADYFSTVICSVKIDRKIREIIEKNNKLEENKKMEKIILAIKEAKGGKNGWFFQEITQM